MKITLIQPYFSTHIITPPLGLGYLASYLLLRGHEVKIYDCVVKELENDEMVSILKKEKPELVGVTIFTMSFPQAKDLIALFKKTLKTTIVIGGPQVTGLPEFTLKETGADMAVVGEGEETLSEIAEELRRKGKNFKKIKGLVFKNKSGEIVRNARRDLFGNLDLLPFPAWGLLEPRNYPPAPHGAFYRRFPVAPIITSRGCPYDCAFCASKVTWQGKLRLRDPKKVVDEIELLVKKFGAREIHFEDDNFVAIKDHALAVCQEIINRKIDIVWACPNGVRIDRLDKKLLKVMKKSGCYLLAFGIESGSQRILNKVNKRLDLKIVPKVLKQVKDIGIQTWGFFIIGLPGETKKTIKETILFAKKLPLDRAQFCKFAPLPGTLVFNEWINDRNLKDLPWKKINFFGDSVYTIKGLSGEELNKFQQKAFREFYLRPKIILSLLRNIKINQARWLLRRFKDYSYFYFLGRKND